MSRRLPFAVLASALALGFVFAPSASAESVVGSHDVFDGVDSNAPGQAEVFQTTAAEDGGITRLSIYLDESNTAQSVELGLYSHSKALDGPYALTTKCVISSDGPLAGGWHSCALNMVPWIAEDREYWVGVLQPADTPGQIRFRDHNGVPDGTGRTYTSSEEDLTSMPGYQYGDPPIFEADSYFQSGNAWDGSGPASIHAD
ncbi:MAG TPA: hypothetical protein VHR40_03200 [Thermoleophilaceae bacterium]|nr:hypothetical protein [Thermoleophilaceae bacterium]